MPNFYFTVWSGQDLGFSNSFDLFTPGNTATIPTNPDPSDILVNDDDNLFQDGAPDNGQQVDQGTPQTLVNDLFIDGLQAGTAGDAVYIAYTMTFTNLTTGQVGSIFLLTVGGFQTGNFVGFVTDVDLNPGDVIQTSGPNNPSSFSATAPYVDLICFTKGTLIRTETGERPVEDLRVGDLIETADHGRQPLKWAGHRHLTVIDLLLRPNFKPIHISANAGVLSGLTRDIAVSPQHRFVVGSHKAELYFCADEVLVPAKSFLGQPGVVQDTHSQSVDYYHLLFENHETVFANGTKTESLHLTQGTARSLTAEGYNEVMALFPELADGMELPHSALPCLTPREAQVLF
jgi:hypothetical protein